MTARYFPQGAFGKWMFIFGLLSAPLVRADQVEMVNGDRYLGRVLSLSSNTLVLQSEVLGTLKLPRARISTIALDTAGIGQGTNLVRVAPANALSNTLARVAASNPTNAAPDFTATMRQLGTNSSLIQQVQSQLLTGAGPEAQNKFNDLLGGLMSGKVDLSGLRAEAKSTLEQARRARGDLGEEGGSMIDSYLTILDSFLKETEPEAKSITNTVPRLVKPKLPNQAAAEAEE